MLKHRHLIPCLETEASIVSGYLCFSCSKKHSRTYGYVCGSIAAALNHS